ncbi:MAG: FliH/SctL family protein [Desulfobacterales bacterium]|nr:FliH/SctL family protein [Desulfobacterales bacterium]
MRKIIKSSNAHRANTFRLHYFPNIPAPADRSQTAEAPDAGGQGPNAAAGSGNGVPQAGDTINARRDGSTREEDQHLERLAKQAYAEGFAQGEKDALALAEHRLNPLVATLENLIAELTDTRQKLHHQIESEVVDLALHIGRKVVGAALQTDPALVAEIVREALKDVEEPEKVRVRLNPADIERLQSTPAKAILGLNADNIQFEEDNAIEAGGCMVHTEYGDIDARITKQFEAIEEAFRAESMGIQNES